MMKFGSFLAAVAAGYVSLSAASAEEGPAGSGHGAGLSRVPVPAVNVAVAPDSTSVPVPPAGVIETPASAEPVKSERGEKVPEAEKTTVAAPKAPVTTLRVTINLSSQSMKLHYDGANRETWAISSGREGHLTPRGTFRPQWAAKMWYSRKYDNAPMPNAVFFVGGVAVHGTQYTRMLGQPASHGCVRLAPANAARFYSLVHKHGFKHARIDVIGSTPATRVSRRQPNAQGQLVSSRGQSGQYGRTVSNRQAPAGNGWLSPGQAPQVRRGSNGVVYLPPNSPYQGRDTFVHNGVVYRRVR